MSQEIQLANVNVPLQPALTPPQLPATAAMMESTPLRRIHRLLRGRYGLATSLAAIGAIFGLAAGVILPKPSFKSVGVVQVKPIIPTPKEDVDRIMPLYIQYMSDVMVKLHAEKTIRQAMQDPQWRELRPYAGDLPPDSQVIDFSNHLDVRQIPNAPEMIQVTYDDSRKDAPDVAQVAVKSIIDSYQKLWGESDFDEDNRKLRALQEEKAKLQTQISNDQSQINLLSPQAGGDALIDREAIAILMQDLNSLEAKLRNAKDMLAMAQADRDKRTKGLNGQQNYSPGDIAKVEPLMAARLTALLEAQVQLQEAESRFGPRHREVLDKKQVVQLREQAVRDAAAEFNERNFIETRPDGTPMSVSKDLSHLEQDVKNYEEQYKSESERIVQLRGNNAVIVRLRSEIDRAQKQVDADDDVIKGLQFQREIGGQFKVIEEGTVPQRSGDRRPVFAALGLLGGAALPIGMLVLIGLANPRYRFSDETGETTKGLNLLGILPDLPDRLSDPEQASIAAHCVHQIRTMLQISGGAEERRVFAVTSAAPGDGKTSLTLALGLSYAACGTRTLLIDCDLIGAGLTNRMNVIAPEGVLEAIANRSLMDYVRSTDVADVSILPVGSAQTLHASTLSPAALRRLIDEARKHFDTILIDTGPILGSIEASLVCAAADAVVVTVARGQQRPLAEKAINHLVGIGAKLAGVVFNRAQSNDFDRSISGVSSLRSVFSGSGSNGNGGSGRSGDIEPAAYLRKTADINEG